MRKFFPYISAILFATVGFSIKAGAQSIIVENNSKFSIEISATELTRISVIGDRINLVRGSAGVYKISNDNIHGAIFIKPIIHFITCPVHKNKKYQYIKNSCQKIKPFYLFVNTEQGRHYILYLIPRSNLKADLLALKPKELVDRAAKVWEISENYPQTLIHLVEIILQQKIPPGYRHIPLNKPKDFYFGKNFYLKLIDQYQGAHLAVRIYQLTNHSKQTRVISEADLYQSSDRAIYLQTTTILPHQTISLIKVINHV